MANTKTVKVKHIEVDEETHKAIKLQALQAGMSMRDYVKLCAVQCKSDKKAK